MIDVGSVHHHAAEQREFRNRRPDAIEIGAERAAVERHRLERAAAQSRALKLLLIVGMGRVRPQLEVGIGLQHGDGLRPAAQKSLAQLGRRTVADHAVEKGRGLLKAVVL